MRARMFIFLVYHYSQNHRATSARHSWDCRMTLVRREAVDGNKCSQSQLANIVRLSRQCLENVVQHSPMIRAIIVRHSCDCRWYVLYPYSTQATNRHELVFY